MTRNSPKVKPEKASTPRRDKSPRGTSKPPRKGSKSSDEDNYVENKQCPVKGCSSQGHMSGLKTHFLQESCPFYHNVAGKSGSDEQQRLKVS